MNVDSPPARRTKWSACLLSISCLAVLAFFVHSSLLANVDLATGRFALGMDERITFDGVRRILHPGGLARFLGAVVDGGDHRYGRSLWNSIAVFSAVPEALFGVPGQIIATRMLQVILISAACCVFAFGLLRTWSMRLVLLVAAMATPFSAYYMTMPKPEPLQLLFLAVFCYFFVRKGASFSWYWIFAGLAFGTKISTLPALLVFLAVALAVSLKSGHFESWRKALAGAVTMFFVGVAIAVPILWLPLLLALGGQRLFRWASRRFSLRAVPRCVLASTEVVIIFIASRETLARWISSTFLNTTHGADQASINALSWLRYFFGDWLIAPPFVGVLLIVMILAYLLFNAVDVLKSGSLGRDERTAALAVALAGLALMIAIILGVKRLWGFYLYTGMMLLVAGAILLVEVNLSGKGKESGMPRLGLAGWAGCLLSLVVLLVAGLYWAPTTARELRQLSLRTHSPEYAVQYSSYQAYTSFLDRYQAAAGKRLRVMLTPSLFPPESNAKFDIVEFWGPYTAWNSRPDVIIFGVINTPRGQPTPRDSPEYKDFLREREGYAGHVAAKGAACKASPCFVRALELPNRGEVLVLSKE